MARVRVPMLVMVLALSASAGCAERDPTQAPFDANPADFCASYARLAGADSSTSADKVEDYVNEFAHFGTPRGIPTAARDGFEYAIDPERKFADGAAFNALASGTDLAGQNAAALKTYVAQICQ